MDCVLFTLSDVDICIGTVHRILQFTPPWQTGGKHKFSQCILKLIQCNTIFQLREFREDPLLCNYYYYPWRTKTFAKNVMWHMRTEHMCIKISIMDPSPPSNRSERNGKIIEPASRCCPFLARKNTLCHCSQRFPMKMESQHESVISIISTWHFPTKAN